MTGHASLEDTAWPGLGCGTLGGGESLNPSVSSTSRAVVSTQQTGVHEVFKYFSQRVRGSVSDLAAIVTVTTSGRSPPHEQIRVMTATLDARASRLTSKLGFGVLKQM